MRYLLHIVTALWLLLQFSGATINNPMVELEPLPRQFWDTELAKRDDDANLVRLANNEKFMWASSNRTHEKATVVSLVVYTKQDQNILDMDKFAFALESVTCSDKITVRFRGPILYFAAKIAWQWVNFNDLRSFVLVTTWKGCGPERSRDPWVVRNVKFDDQRRQVIMDATQSTWKKVSNTYTLDFGDIVLGGKRNDKRVLDVSLNKAFTLDLSSKFPTELVNWNVSNGVVDAKLGINCNDCGTKGNIVFAGHIEASLFGGIEKFELSAKPNGVSADVNLSLDFEGEIDFVGLDPYSKEWTLLQLPLPSGWKIPHLLTFGPNIKINAGVQIDYIGGKASASAGISAKIPDSSIAKVDLASKKPVTISGWKPEIQTKPLTIAAQVYAGVKVYTEIAVAVSLEVLDDTGINVDVALRVPEVDVRVTGGYEPQGFCEGKPEPWGVKLDSSLAASLYLEGYTEVNGDRNVFLNVPLYQSPTLYTFPQLCVSFGTISEGFCLAEPHPDAEGSPAQRRRRELVSAKFSPRQITPFAPPASGGRTYWLPCDQNREHAIRLQSYPQPRDVKSVKEVPVINPKIPCSSNNCPPSLWEIELPQDRSVVGHKTWATEHVYEGNWIPKYINFLEKYYKTPTNTDKNCNGRIDSFGGDGKNIQTPDPQPANNFSEALMQNLATSFTYKTHVTLLPQTQNTYKYLMFENNDIAAWLKTNTATRQLPNNHEKRVCAVGRIVTTCKYMDHPEVQKRLDTTIMGIEGLLDNMDRNSTIYKPSGVSLKNAHREFFDEMYKKGIQHTREKLVEYAAWIQNHQDFATLSADKQSAIMGIQSDPKKYCPSTRADR